MSAIPPKADIGGFIEQPRRWSNVLSRRPEEDVLCNALRVALGDKVNQPGSITVLMTWITPLDCSTLLIVISAASPLASMTEIGKWWPIIKAAGIQAE